MLLLYFLDLTQALLQMMKTVTEVREPVKEDVNPEVLPTCSGSVSPPAVSLINITSSPIQRN